MYRNSLRILPVIVLSVAALALLAAVTAAAALNLARTEPGAAQAVQVSILSAAVPYTQNFDSLATAGTTNPFINNVTLDGWYSNRTVYIADAGTSNTGGMHSYGITGTVERALGSVGSGTANPVLYGVRMSNDTGAAIASFVITYTGEQWRSGANPNTLEFACQTSAVITDITAGVWIAAPALNFTGPITAATANLLDGNASANRRIISGVVTVNVPAGNEVMFRWRDIDDGSSDQGIALDDLTIVPAPAAAPAADLSIVKLAPASVNVSQTFTYTLIATNRISDTARSVVITDAVPLSATIAGVSDDGVATDNVVSWTIDSVLNGQSITRTIVVTAPPAATTLINGDYGVWAGNYLTRATGSAVSTQVTASDCGGVFTPTYAVQGSGASSPLIGQAVTIEGVVVGDFQAATQQNGFYLQDPIGDGDSATSDGIFIYAPGSLEVTVGDAVRVSGTVAEYNGQTEINSVTALQVCRSGPPLAPIVIDLPVAATGDQERFEGMYVTIPETLTVDQNYFQGHYGQVTLSADGRLYTPTNGNGFSDTVELNARRMVVLDDGSTVSYPNPIPYIGLDSTLRAGDVITNLTGVIDYGPINSDAAIRHYRLQPTGPVTITRANARSAAPDPVGGSIRVASFNVLNYFNGDGAGGGFPTARGATTLIEFNRQRDKIIPAIAALNADVVGLMEIENDGADSSSAIQDLVNGLNAATSAGTYAFVAEPAPGADEIKVALIYQTARVAAIGSALNYQITTTYVPLFDRPPLAQRFRAPNGQEFFVIVNHFKSKGCDGAAGVDADYGQGCWNAKRVAQAAGLLDWIATLQATDPGVIVIGDLNAYGAEDPINTLVAGGLINQAQRVPAATRYSYVFDGQAGYLDQALTTASLEAHITGVTYWHINADEPSVIDYNTEFKLPDLYAATPYRASDHDPVLIGLGTPADFSGSVKRVNTTTIAAGQVLTYTLIVSNSGEAAANFTLTDTLNAALMVISAPGLTQNGSTLSVSGSIGGLAQAAFTITAQTPITFSGQIANAAALGGDGQVRQLDAPAVTVAPVSSPLIINELDADTPGADVAEFVELYDGGVGHTPLTGYTMVLFNGSGDVVYSPIFDLDGYATDVNGYFLIGGRDISLTANLTVTASSWLQNGPDAVALYYGDAADFPSGTPVTNTQLSNLIDALVYNPNGAAAPGLQMLLNAGQPQVNENGRGAGTTQSVQRCPNGSGGARNTITYSPVTPTPGAANACPAITSVGPLNNATDVLAGANITATFNMTMTNISPATFTLAGPTGPVAGAVSYAAGANTATFDPAVNLAGSTRYTATLSADLAASSGLTLTTAYVWSFTTAALPFDLSTSAKGVNTTTITAGEGLTYTLIVSNSGDVTTTFYLTDTLNAALTVISAPGLTQTGSTLSVSDSIGGQSTRAFTITARTAITFSGQITNVAALSGDGQVYQLNAPVVTVNARPANVSASFKASPSQLTPGGLITFTFTLANSGSLSATVRLTPTLDGRYFTLSDALDFTPTLRWSGNVPPGGDSQSVRYAARVKDLGQLPIGAATIDNAARFDDGAHAPITLSVPMSITVYGGYVPLVVK